MSFASLGSPTMSDRTLLLSVEDLIGIAMGPREGNTVNFKLIQTILHILARQMRVLEQKVVLVGEELPVERSQSRGRSRSRSHVSKADRPYRRPPQPEFKTDDQRIAWEKKQDELERRDQRRSRSKSQFKLKRGVEVVYDDNDQGTGERRRGGPKRSSVHDEPGREASGAREHDDEHGGRGRRHDRDREHGGRGRRYDEDEERGDRGRPRGGRHDGDDEDHSARGHGRSEGGRHDGDDEDHEGHGRGRSGGGRHDRDDEEHGGHGRSGTRGADKHEVEDGETHVGGRDEGRQGKGRDRAGSRGADKYGVRDGHDTSAGRRRDSYEDEDESIEDVDGSIDRSGADGSEYSLQGRGRSVGPDGRYSDDEGTRGHGTGGRGADSRGGIDEKGRRTRSERGLEGKDDGSIKERRRRGEDGGGRETAGRGTGGRDGFDGKGTRSTPGGGMEGQDDGRVEVGGRRGEGRGVRGRDEAAQGEKLSIGVREIEGPGKEKLLVVEKGPTTTGAARDRDGIAVVTQSQFQLLEAQVEELWRAAKPPPQPAMPDNRQLRKELAAGASLTDAMQAMQVSARVQAAEQAISKLGGLLTQLAASGALPPDAAGAVRAAGWADEDEDEVQLKSKTAGTAFEHVEPSGKSTVQSSKTPPGAAGVVSKDGEAAGKFVTKSEMGFALARLRDEVAKALQAQVDKASASAAHAEKTAKTLGDKVEELLQMDKLLTDLHCMVEDYMEQLNGFDAGLSSQIESFKEQMATMRTDLQGGLDQLEISNSNPETAAVLELNERFEGLVRVLDDTLLQHTSLCNTQQQLTQELKTLVEGVEMLREQKADHDELLDILRDKADYGMLEGLVRLEEFQRAQEDLELRLDSCDDKFKRQDDIWMGAMKDLRELVDTKAQLTDLLKIRDEAREQLQSIDDRIQHLSLILGEPKAAVLMRALARDAVCGSCLTPAMMPPGGEPRPPALPAARPAPAPAPAPPAPCEPELPDYPDFRTHRCHRWVGGSHTLLPRGRAHAAPIEVTDVANKYTGYGDDGRVYWLEKQMEPCVECNEEVARAPPGGAGAAGDAPGAVAAAGTDNCDC